MPRLTQISVLWLLISQLAWSYVSCKTVISITWESLEELFYYIRFTRNHDQPRTDLRVEKFWMSWTREQSLNVYRQMASMRLNRLAYE